MATKHNSTQQHLPIAQIRDSVVVMKDGTLRSVMIVSSINFALKSQQEQDGIIFQFQNFLNGLSGPIQIVVQSRQLDLSGYLQDLGTLAQNQTNELLRFQMTDYIDFVGRLITLANIMEKRFFVVMPYTPVSVNTNGLLGMLMGGRKTTPHFSQKEFDRYKELLAEETDVLISGLSSMGLRAVRLNTQELVEFFYSLYNPEESGEEKLVDVDQLRAGVVQRGGQHA